MKKLTVIIGLISILSLLFVTTGCDNDDDGLVGCTLAEAFSMIIVDENDNNLLDPLNPDNIIEKLEMEIVCSDGKVVPLSWIPNEYIAPRPGFPTHNADNPYSFAYSSRYNCLVIGYWDGDSMWETSFRIRIPECGIDLNVAGNNKGLYERWRVNNTECKPIAVPISSEHTEYVNYKLTLSINSPSNQE